MNPHYFILIDGSAYLYRAFHALPPLTNRQGFPTGAIYGLTGMLKRLLNEYQPQHIAVVFDAPTPTFRHELYPDYKGNRSSMPEELQMQVALALELIHALGLPLLQESGIEADDLIATLATQAQELGMHTLIFSGDKDFTQLVGPTLTLIDTLKENRLDSQGVQEKFGVPPHLIVDYLTLVGDAVDNIPGVAKVGPKTAVKWLTQYGSLENLVKNAHQIKGKVGENLRESIAKFPLVQQLLTLQCTLSLPYDPKHLIRQPEDTSKLHALFTRLEFKQWLKDLPTPRESIPLNLSDSPHYHPILTWEALQTWLTRLAQSPLWAFDTETTGLDYLTANIVGLSFAIVPKEAIYIPLGHDYQGAPEQLPRDLVLQTLKPLFENPRLTKIGQNLKYDAHILKNHGIDLQGTLYDTLLESYLLDSTSRHDLDSLVDRYLGLKSITYKEVTGKGKQQRSFSQVEIKTATEYAAQDADFTLQLHHALWAKLHTFPALLTLLTELEMPLLPVLMRMERHGVCIETNQLQNYSVELGISLQQLAEQVQQLAGEKFNLNSPKQLQYILFDKLQLPIQKKTPKKVPSTDVEVLEELAQHYPLPRLILEHRSLSKLRSTYTDSLLQQVNPHTQRIHTNYQQTVTITGRLSSTHPNLQNIPIRTSEGRRIRQAFVAPPHHYLLAADYSQIELRIMAHLSEDPRLLAAFNSEQDIHQATAAEVFKVPVTEVTPEQRRHAKAVNFGLIYGMQAFGLAKQLGIEVGQAQHYIDDYFQRYIGVKTYMETIREQARQQGYVETLFGRRLYLSDIRSSSSQQRQYAERTAINAPMQGTAADIIKRAMISVDRWIQQETAGEVRMLMQVHDELVFEVAESKVEQAKSMIRELMSQAATLKVPLTVEIGTGRHWDEAH